MMPLTGLMFNWILHTVNQTNRYGWIWRMQSASNHPISAIYMRPYYQQLLTELKQGAKKA
jgi:hypothetical protein